MPRPHVEALALLAAHGLPAIPLDPRRRPRMPDAVRFALLPAEAQAKPIVFSDINALARHIQRARGDAGLDLQWVQDLEVRGDAENRPGVSVFITDLDGGRPALIGHAYIDGLPLDALQAAIRRNRLPLTPIQQAA